MAADTIMLRATEDDMNAFNATLHDLLDGQNQVMLEVRLIQLAHTNSRNTGVQPPQSITAFNVYAEEQSILNANQALVQQIISSGLASPNDPLAILGLLLASGRYPVPSSRTALHCSAAGLRSPRFSGRTGHPELHPQL